MMKEGFIPMDEQKKDQVTEPEEKSELVAILEEIGYFA